MKTLIKIFLIFIGFSTIGFAQDLGGWFKAGSAPASYEIGLDDNKHDGMPVYFMKSTQNVTDGFGTIMTQTEAGKYIGKRLKLSGYIKCEKVEKNAGMWMRIDAYKPGLMLGFDNMDNRPIGGTTDWQKYEIVLDIPDSSAQIAYGVLVNGNGNVWLSGLSFEAVSMDIPVTDMLFGQQVQMQIEPVNAELPAEIRNIPDGIEVKHDPGTAYATKTKDDTAMYYWFYKTSVKAISEDLEITQFGSYLWFSDGWVFGNISGKPFEPKDFAEWYSCKGSKMKKGKEYSDPGNWNKAPTLQDGKILWYYIGRNKEGELFKGTAIVNYLPEMKK